MRLSVQHFIDLGHRRIGLISPPPGLNFGVHRLQSYFDTMGDNGLSVQSEWIVTGDMSQVSGFNVVESLLALDSRPTAIIGGNDLMAIGAIKRIQQSGLQVGKDIAVCGFDDIPLAAFVNPPLTTIHQPIYDIGKQTTALLIDIINNRRLANVNILLAPTLVVRESSGKPIG
jgi:LacI family transcriptional regulator